MDNIGTVTIPINEYVELRRDAEVNLFLSAELGCMNGRITEIANRLCDLEAKVNNP